MPKYFAAPPQDHPPSDSPTDVVDPRFAVPTAVEEEAVSRSAIEAEEEPAVGGSRVDDEKVLAREEAEATFFSFASRRSRSSRARLSQCRPCTRPAPRLARRLALPASPRALGRRDMARTSASPHRRATHAALPSPSSGSARRRASHATRDARSLSDARVRASACSISANADAGAQNAGTRSGVSKLGLGSRFCVGGYLGARSGHRNTTATAPAACARCAKRGACLTTCSCARQPPRSPRNTATAPSRETSSSSSSS